MCFPKGMINCKEYELKPAYNEDDRSFVTEEYIPNANTNECVIPEGLHEHIDSVYLNFSLEDGILCFIYETSHQTLYVWTSHEVMLLNATLDY